MDATRRNYLIPSMKRRPPQIAGVFYLKQIIMKKLVLVSALAIGLFSCQKEVVTQQPVKNCNCDRIVKIVAYTIIGTPSNPKPTNHATIYTVNDCTNFNDWDEWKSTEYKYFKKVGDCK